MRITNQMMTNSILLNINRNKETLAMYEEQLSTGKKIQKPSDDPIVAVRALRYRTNVSEITQYKTNAEDATSWASVSEQAVSNVTDILKRVRELSVQAASDVMSLENRQNSLTEIDELMEQFLNEANASYAGRYVFSGHKTNVPAVFTEESSDDYQLTQSFTSESVAVVDRVIGNDIVGVNRIRLGYDDITTGDVATLATDLAGAGFTAVNDMTSTDANAYEPAAGQVNFLADTGELIFNEADLGSIPDFDFTYNKSSFNKTDLVPDHYFNGTNLTTGAVFTVGEEAMDYQISYSQELTVNTMAYDVVPLDLQRDIEELVTFASSIVNDDSVESELNQDVLGEMFSDMLGIMDGHIDKLLNTRAEIGGKISRLELTISRLDADELNFTELMSKNEDVDFSEAYIKMSSMETIYQASLNASSKILQPTLLDFIR